MTIIHNHNDSDDEDENEGGLIKIRVNNENASS
jgi:hypothetical protein